MADDTKLERFFSLFERGTKALRHGDTATAARLLERAIALDSGHVDAALNLSAAFVLEKRFSDAVGVLEQLSKVQPDNPMVWTNLGAAYLGNPVLARDDDQRRAICAFERAIQLDPAAPNVAYNLGLVHRDRHELELALDWFRRALETDPNDRDAQRYLERMRQMLQDSQSHE